MAFDEISFPLAVGYGARGGPQFNTDVIVIAGGYERRNQNWSQARRRYDARTGIRSSIDAALLTAFFHARAGRARGFRLKDWAEFTSSSDGVSPPHWGDQAIGAGDGETTTYQLLKTYGDTDVSHKRLIRKPVAGTVLFAVDGVPRDTGWSVDTTTGLVTFSEAPQTGQIITAGFEFDVPVRFDTDRLDLTSRDENTAHGDIPLIEVRV